MPARRQLGRASKDRPINKLTLYLLPTLNMINEKYYKAKEALHAARAAHEK
jgi:hypothetical protein